MDYESSSDKSAMASTDTQSNNSSSKNFVAQLPKSHKSTGSLNSMNSRDSIKQIDLEKELVKANAFTENILDVLMTLQFEVIDNRKMDSERLDKIISELSMEVRIAAQNTNNQFGLIKDQLEQNSSQVKELISKEDENSRRINELSGLIKSMLHI